jgi:DNA/RNA-binding protein KIN17
MPKAEAGTPKWLANKMKSKGLQKLRWFCQMCEKQCRDENGFKCHTSSESHQRQLLLFAENPHRYLDDFSKEFKDGYVELLRRRYGTKRVNANQVYQEYISDKNHLHMNATKWLSLTEFIKYLGREGVCTVDETEKGWFVTWIDRDPETIAREQQLAKKQKMDKDDNERMLEFIEKQVERAGSSDAKQVEYSEFIRANEDDKLSLKLNPLAAPKPIASIAPNQSVFKAPFAIKKAESVKSFSSTSSSGSSKRKSALEELREEQERMKEKKFKQDYWLIEGITVKVITKALGDKYYKEKGVVLQVIDKYTALVKMHESGSKLKLDQEHLETVIPAAGKLVKILNSHLRGSEAEVLSVDIDDYSVTVKVRSGTYSGQTVRGLKYENVCKLDSEYINSRR